MKPIQLGVGEPFSHPAWGSNFMVFTSESGNPVAESSARDYLNRATAFAKHHQIYLVPERMIIANHHVLCLINPQGEVLQAQQALFLAPEHMHLSQGTTIDLVDTEFGRIFLCVDVDVYYPEVTRIASNLGAQYVIACGSLSPEEYTNHQVIAGPWNMAQSGNLFVIGVTNVYHCVCAPRIIRQYRQGFVVPPNRKIPMLATMKATALEHLPARPHLASRIYVAHEKELLEG